MGGGCLGGVSFIYLFTLFISLLLSVLGEGYDYVYQFLGRLYLGRN